MNIPAPFTQSQVDYFRRSCNSWFNVAEGGKRGGKNVINTLAFCMALEVHPDKMHLIAGVSQSTAQLNIMDCDGFGLLNFFEGRCRPGKFRDRACLYIQTKAGEKIVLVAGGAKAGDEKYIKGNSYGMAYVTEANECHPDFIREVFDRTLASRDRKIFHDLNPKSPEHWYYTDIINPHEEKQQNDPEYGYNYGHFTIADNLSISDEKLRVELNRFKKGTVWYNRDILGLRCIAEGLIYQEFCDHESEFYIDSADVPRRDKLACICIGQDFGGNKSKNTFCASAISADFSTLYVLKSEEYNSKGMSVEDDVKCLQKFVAEIQQRFGRVDAIFADSAEQTIINTERSNVAVQIRNSVKNLINDRIRATDLMMTERRLKIVKHGNDSLIAAFRSAIWDDKKNGDERADYPGITNVCPLDAFEYSWEWQIRKLITANLRR